VVHPRGVVPLRLQLSLDTTGPFRFVPWLVSCAGENICYRRPCGALVHYTLPAMLGWACLGSSVVMVVNRANFNFNFNAKPVPQASSRLQLTILAIGKRLANFVT
jgi:hypothetical protein